MQREGAWRLFVGYSISDPPLTRWVCGAGQRPIATSGRLDFLVGWSITSDEVDSNHAFTEKDDKLINPGLGLLRDSGMF